MYAADAGHNLYKVGLQGNLIWKTEWEGSPYHESHLVGAGSILYCIENVGDGVHGEPTGSQITAYNMENGNVLWKHYFGDESWAKGPPAVSDGIIVAARTSGRIVALASNPPIFVDQGDTFLDAGKTENAITSYEKAVKLYKKKGDESRIEEIQQKISELENSSEPLPSETTPPKTIPPQPSTRISFFVLIFTGILSGIFIVYFLIKQKE